jgi:hypothetical protein
MAARSTIVRSTGTYITCGGECGMVHVRVKKRRNGMHYLHIKNLKKMKIMMQFDVFQTILYDRILEGYELTIRTRQCC